jgi:hypothetical protein
MLTHRGRYNIFSGYDFRQYCEDRAGTLAKEIYEAAPEYLLNVEHDNYVEYLVNKYALEPVKFAFLDMTVQPGEADVPAEHFPPMSIVDEGHTYRKPVYQYYLPYAGDQQLLRAVPNPNAAVPYVVDIGGDSVSFTIVDFYGNPEHIKMEAHRIVELIKVQSDHLNKNIDDYNGTLWEQARCCFQQRRSELEKQLQVTTALGVPVRRRDNLPVTFAVQVARKRIEVKPKATPRLSIPSRYSMSLFMKRYSKSSTTQERCLNVCLAPIQQKAKSPCGIISYWFLNRGLNRVLPVRLSISLGRPTFLFVMRSLMCSLESASSGEVRSSIRRRSLNCSRI